MEPYITVTNHDGWRKEFPLQGNLIYLGSSPDNHISLGREQGQGVAPRHLQLIAMPGGFRAVNLGEASITVDDVPVEPRFAVDVGDCARLALGDFSLIFHLDEVVTTRSGGATATPSNAIGLGLSLPRTVILRPDQPVDGTVIVRNQGNESGVQFQIELEGLQESSYEMGPGPILFPNAEKEVFLRLHHPRKPYPPAGEHQIRIRASAPDAYPGQSAVESRTVTITPYFCHELRLRQGDEEKGRDGTGEHNS
jgi:hypothetical protein